MKIAIVGAGALGLYYGAMLAKQHDDVHFLLRSDYDAIRRNGLKVNSINGDFYLPEVKCYNKPSDIGRADLVVVGLKTFANDRYRELISDLVKDETLILTLQNGLGNEDALAEIFGAEKIIGGVAFLCSNRGEPGVVNHIGAGRIVIGNFASDDVERVQKIASIFISAGVECKITDDLLKSRWEKLVWNIPFNGLSALLLQSVDKILATKESRMLVKDIMLEVIAAANGDSLSKNIDIEFADKMLEFTDKMGVYKPSMQIDREENRELELDAIFFKPVKRGEGNGLKMPLTRMLSILLKQIGA